MRILSLVVAGVLALSFSASASWAGPAGLGSGGSKTPAAKSCSTKKCSPAADKPRSSQASKPASKTAKKPGEVNLGSAARQELLKKRLQDQSKSAKGKTLAPKKTIKKKS
jgi:hypothetical protein